MSTKTAATKRKKRTDASRMPEAGEPTWDIAYLFPAQGTWTEDDYLNLDGISEGHPFVELSNGRLEILPMPTQTHQMIMIFLYELLNAFTALRAPGLVLVSGMRVRLQKGARAKFRDPDILYMKAEHAHRRHEKYWDGADLVMEVVSSDRKDRERDLKVKPLDYARARIPEYWIIDPEQQRIRVLTLRGRTYRLHGEFGPGTQATSVLLPGFTVSVDDVFAAGRKSRMAHSGPKTPLAAAKPRLARG
jgi:Uma2 family endonuclease